MTSETVFRSKNRGLAAASIEALEAERPMTLRQLYYRLVSAGALANRQAEYKRLGAVMTRLREAGEVPRNWIVDHVRATLKPSSWSGLGDFAETVREVYRKDFWASLDHHVEVFVEKDAIAGTIQPVTSAYDVALRVCRGYSSVSFAGEVADLWMQVEKPIFAYYLGDYDPSGHDLERDLREKLERYSERHCAHAGLAGDSPGSWYDSIHTVLRHPEYNDFKGSGVYWFRLAIRGEDFDEYGLIELPVKRTDSRARKFLQEHGGRCAEVDALPPSELRRRVREAIEAHIDQVRWGRLQDVERAEKQTLDQVARGWEGGPQEKPGLGQVSPNAAGGDPLP